MLDRAKMPTHNTRKAIPRRVKPTASAAVPYNKCIIGALHSFIESVSDKSVNLFFFRPKYAVLCSTYSITELFGVWPCQSSIKLN